MAHPPTQESDDQKVFRIARELGISLEDAAVTCAGFELAFSDDRMRRAIFEIIDQLDESAARKGEPLGLIIRYTVELGMDGIRVGRYADEIPAGEVVELTPTNRAMIFLKIKDNFPTQQFLGPLIVNRPEPLYEEQFSVGRDVSTDTEITEPEIPTELPSHWNDVPICLGPIRLKFEERFPFISSTVPKARRGSIFQSADCTALAPPHHLPPWAALQAGMLALQSASGLSPPPPIGERGHSVAKDVLRHWQ